MAAISFTGAARQDVVRILQYLVDESGDVIACDYDRSFENLFIRVAANPRLYPLRPLLGEYVRVAGVQPYRVLYRYDRVADAVTFLRIVHSRRRIRSDFMDLS